MEQDGEDRRKKNGRKQGPLARTGAVMSRSDKVQRIVASLHEAAIDPGGWSKASALIEETLGIRGTGIVCSEGNNEREVRVFEAVHMVAGQRFNEHEREYFESYFAQDERLPRLRKLPDSELRHIRQLYSEAELKTSATFHEFFPRVHGQDSICVRLDGLNRSRIVLQFHDRLNGNGWSSPDLDLIRRLLPHIRQTWIVRQELASARALGNTLEDLLETTGLGIVHLDARGRIKEANDSARRILKEGYVSYDMDRRLLVRNRQDNHEFRQVMSRALPSFGTQAIAGSVPLNRSNGLPPLGMHVTPVRGSDKNMQPQPVAALAVLVDPLVEARIDPAFIQKALNLTRAQTTVAVLLAQGKDVRTIAASIVPAEGTVRWHVKRIREKLGLTRQSELVDLVRSLRTVR